MSSPSPTELLNRALAITSSQAKLATALDMNRSRLNRVIGGDRLGIPNCLRLAALIDEPPHVVLRAWKYDAEADILQRGYDPPRLTNAQLNVAERFAKLSPKRKRLVIALLDESE